MFAILAGPCPISDGAVDGVVDAEDFRLEVSLVELCLLSLELLIVGAVL